MKGAYYLMETVKFTVVRVSADMCRIVPHDIRDIFKKIADGGCIMSIEIMLDVMEQITKDCQAIGFTALFEV